MPVGTNIKAQGKTKTSLEKKKETGINSFNKIVRSVIFTLGNETKKGVRYPPEQQLYNSNNNNIIIVFHIKST